MSHKAYKYNQGLNFSKKMILHLYTTLLFAKSMQLIANKLILYFKRKGATLNCCNDFFLFFSSILVFLNGQLYFQNSKNYIIIFFINEVENVIVRKKCHIL